MGEKFCQRRRRLFVGGFACLAAPAVLAQQCRVTPRDGLGPFYKPNAPAQSELCGSGSGGKERLVVTGRVLGVPGCMPLAGALVEVWQADARGEYTQVDAGRRDDPGCLLRASLTADADGRYRFQTIVPGEYPGRPRHIHYRVSARGHATLVTQFYFAHESGIPPDLVVNVTQKNGAHMASFDITLTRA